MTNNLEINLADPFTKKTTSTLLGIAGGIRIDELLSEILDTNDLVKMNVSHSMDMFYCNKTIGKDYKVAFLLRVQQHNQVLVSARIVMELPALHCAVADIKKAIQFYSFAEAAQLKELEEGCRGHYHRLVKRTLEGREQHP